MHWKMTKKKNTLPDPPNTASAGRCLMHVIQKVENEKKNFHSLNIGEGSRHCLSLSETTMDAKAKK